VANLLLETKHCLISHYKSRISSDSEVFFKTKGSLVDSLKWLASMVVTIIFGYFSCKRNDLHVVSRS